jgi:hypothetical protein
MFSFSKGSPAGHTVARTVDVTRLLCAVLAGDRLVQLFNATARTPHFERAIITGSDHDLLVCETYGDTVDNVSVVTVQVTALVLSVPHVRLVILSSTAHTHTHARDPDIDIVPCSLITNKL